MGGGYPLNIFEITSKRHFEQARLLSLDSLIRPTRGEAGGKQTQARLYSKLKE